METTARELGSVRYLVDDVGAAVDFYGCVRVGFDARPAVAVLVRGSLRLLVDDIDAEVARLTAAGVPFRNEVLDGPGGRQVLVEDPYGNPVELFQPA